MQTIFLLYPFKNCDIQKIILLRLIMLFLIMIYDDVLENKIMSTSLIVVFFLKNRL